MREVLFLSFTGLSVCWNLLDSFVVTIYSSLKFPCPAASSACLARLSLWSHLSFLMLFLTSYLLLCSPLELFFCCSSPAFVHCCFLCLPHIVSSWHQQRSTLCGEHFFCPGLPRMFLAIFSWCAAILSRCLHHRFLAGLVSAWIFLTRLRWNNVLTSCFESIHVVSWPRACRVVILL